MTRNPRRIRWTIAALYLTTTLVAGAPTSRAGDGLAAIDAFHVGRLHLASGRHDEALEAFNDALRMNPQFVQGYLARGKLLAEMGRHSSALADLNFALHLQPMHAEGYAYRGFALLSTARPDEALADFDRALQIDPSYARVHYLRGQALGIVGRHADAEAEMKTALRLDPTIVGVQIASGAVAADEYVVLQAAPTLPERTSVIGPVAESAVSATDRNRGNVIRFERHPTLAKLAPPSVSQPQPQNLSPPLRSPGVTTAVRPMPTVPRSAKVRAPSRATHPQVVPSPQSEFLVQQMPTVVADDLPVVASPSAEQLLTGAVANAAEDAKPSWEASSRNIEAALATAKQAAAEQGAAEQQPTAAADDTQMPDTLITDSAPVAAGAPPETSPAVADAGEPVPPAVAETAQIAATPLPDMAPPTADASVATAELDEAVRENPGDAQLRCRRGSLRLEQNLFAAAAADFEEALKVDPANVAARYGRARANYLAGQWEAAIDDYAAVLRQDDQHAAALIERGHCHSRLGRTVEAAHDREAALALDPSLAKTGPKYEVAILAPSVAAGPESKPALQALPSVFNRSSRRDAAVQPAVPAASDSMFRKAVVIGNESSPSATALASAPAASPFEVAARELTSELQKTPGDARLYELRAQALLALGRAEDAVDDLTAALRIDPTSNKALLLRSRANETLGRAAEAQADRDRAQAVAPATP